MKKALALTLLLAPVLVLAAPGPKPGHLVVVGGGGTTDAILDRALELAGGPGASVVVLPQASGREDRGVSSVEMWEERGAKAVRNLDGIDGDEAARAIEEADLVWIPGGSQGRFMEAWRETDVPEAIRAARARGAVVGGTSAGAAVMSSAMITGEADLRSVRRGRTELVEGLGLWPGALVDQHFLRRQRSNRLLAAVLDRPELLGVGIDERTAAIVGPDGSIEVVGESGVLVIDARDAELADTKEDAPWGATGIAVHLLREGMVFEPGE